MWWALVVSSSFQNHDSFSSPRLLVHFSHALCLLLTQASSDKSPKASYDLLPEQLGSRKKRPGHPRFKSQSDGYLQSDIAKVEAIVKQLKAAQDILSEDNMRKQALIDVYGRGICSADTHLSYLLISQCAFSRETRNVLMLEEANQASYPLSWVERK